MTAEQHSVMIASLAAAQTTAFNAMVTIKLILGFDNPIYLAARQTYFSAIETNNQFKLAATPVEK